MNTATIMAQVSILILSLTICVHSCELRDVNKRIDRMEQSR